MQKRNYTQSSGPFYFLFPEAEAFIRKWKGHGEDPRFTVETIATLVRVATDPFYLSGHDASRFGSQYAIAPDFVLALLSELRKHWRKDSKQQRLQRWLLKTDLDYTVPIHAGRAIRHESYFLKELPDRFNKETRAKGKDAATERDVWAACAALKKGEESTAKAIARYEKRLARLTQKTHPKA